MAASHSCAVFNLAYSIGTFVGPNIGGQVLDAIGTRRGWYVLAGLGAGLSAAPLVPIAIWMGGPVGRRKEEVEE